jgi:hypothetical protein
MKVKVTLNDEVVFEGESDSCSILRRVEEVGGTLVPQDHLKEVSVHTDTHEVLVRPATKIVEKVANPDSNS